MRGFQAAYALSYHYSWPGAPVSGLELDLRDHGNTLRVTGPTVEQVETISAGIERELVQHSATDGYVLRSTGRLVIGIVLLVVLMVGLTICFSARQWGFLGIPILSFVGLILLFVLPLDELFAGFAVYQGDPSVIVRYEPQIAFGGLIISIVLALVIPMWYEAKRKCGAPSS